MFTVMLRIEPRAAAAMCTHSGGPLQCVYAAACSPSSADLLLRAHDATTTAMPSTGLCSLLDLLIDSILCLPRVKHAGKAVAVASITQVCVLHLRQLVLHLRIGN